MGVTDLPAVNASLNGLAAVLLFLGWLAIKKDKPDVHKRYMISALVVSTIFLICYLTYHGAHGSTKYEGQGFMRILYFFILITHIPLAALVVPACLIAVRHAFKGRLEKHTRITKWLWPVWMYVSVTGVLIYVMLYLL